MPDAVGNEIDDLSLLEDGDIVFISAGAGFKAASSGGGACVRRGRRRRRDAVAALPDGGTGIVAVGEVVGGYRIGRLLGRGGFGEVRLGVHTVSGQQAAIKFLPRGEGMSAADAERITNEISVTSELDHPNVIRLLQVINHPSFVAIVLEYAPGGDLKGYLSSQSSARATQPHSGSSSIGVSAAAAESASRRSSSTSASSSSTGHLLPNSSKSRDPPAGLPASLWVSGLTEDDTRSKFLQIAKGVGYAHSHRVIHRDLKLDNVLIGSLGECKISDFGLSQYSSSHTGEKNNGASGSLYYMAPEILRIPPQYSEKLDVWCMGIILYCLFTSRLPFVSLAVLQEEARLRSAAQHPSIYNHSNNASIVPKSPARSSLPPEPSIPDANTNVPSNNSIHHGRPPITPVYGARAERPSFIIGSPQPFNGASSKLPQAPGHARSSSPVQRTPTLTAPPAALGVAALPSPSANEHGGKANSSAISIGGGATILNDDAGATAADASTPAVGVVTSSIVRSQPVTPVMPMLQRGTSVAPASGSGAEPAEATDGEFGAAGYADASSTRQYFHEAERAVDVAVIIRETKAAILSGKFYLPPFIAQSACSLLQRMLCVDPEMRPTVAEVLVHPWLNDHAESTATLMRIPSFGSYYTDHIRALQGEGAGLAANSDAQTAGSHELAGAHLAEAFAGHLTPAPSSGLDASGCINRPQIRPLKLGHAVRASLSESDLPTMLLSAATSRPTSNSIAAVSNTAAALAQSAFSSSQPDFAGTPSAVADSPTAAVTAAPAIRLASVSTPVLRRSLTVIGDRGVKNGGHQALLHPKAPASTSTSARSHTSETVAQSSSRSMNSVVKPSLLQRLGARHGAAGVPARQPNTSASVSPGIGTANAGAGGAASIGSNAPLMPHQQSQANTPVSLRRRGTVGHGVSLFPFQSQIGSVLQDGGVIGTATSNGIGAVDGQDLQSATPNGSLPLLSTDRGSTASVDAASPLASASDGSAPYTGGSLLQGNNLVRTSPNSGSAPRDGITVLLPSPHVSKAPRSPQLHQQLPVRPPKGMMLPTTARRLTLGASSTIGPVSLLTPAQPSVYKQYSKPAVAAAATAPTATSSAAVTTKGS